MLFYNSNDLSESFINCYIYDNNYPYLEDKLQLVFDCDKIDDNYAYNYKKMLKNKYFYNHYSYSDNGNKEKFVFIIPPERKRDYKLILEGKYSNISETYKQQILFFWNKNMTNRLGGILRRVDWTTNSAVPIQYGELLSPPTDIVIKEYNPFEYSSKSKGLLIK